MTSNQAGSQITMIDTTEQPIPTDTTAPGEASGDPSGEASGSAQRKAAAAVPASIYEAGPDIDLLDADPTEPPAPSALERLGQSPFPKSDFRFLGFLAAVYDHVSTLARQRTGR